MRFHEKIYYIQDFIREHGHSKAIWIFSAKMEAAETEAEYQLAKYWRDYMVRLLAEWTRNDRYLMEFGLCDS